MGEQEQSEPNIEEQGRPVSEHDTPPTDADQTVIEFETVTAPSRKEFYRLLCEIGKLKDDVHELLDLPKNSTLINTLRASDEILTPVQDMYRILNLSKRIDALEETMSKFAQLLEEVANGGSNTNEFDNRLKILEDKVTDINAYVSRFDELESKFLEYKDLMSTIDDSFNVQVNALQEQLNDLEKEIGEIIEKFNICCPADQDYDELRNMILAMQKEVEHLTAATSTLMKEKGDRQEHMDALLEQIELLKTIKADREDLEDALANKADTCAVNRKVSHDQFDAAYDDLSRNIEEALKKLLEQETLWQQALRDIQEEIEHKLDKDDLGPLKDFIQNKIKMLQDRLKALAGLRKDTEAAGAKSKYLRDVNCISCDKDVVMRKEMDPSLMTPAPGLPPTKSMGPYLAYELDQLRKEQKGASHGKNMNYLENAINAKKIDTDHLCNRYCGGSHTVTTPQQRVARVGHFLMQWGDAAKQDADVETEDQQMSKSENKTPMIVSKEILTSRSSGGIKHLLRAPPQKKQQA